MSKSITVILVTHNSYSRIESCLDSILGEDFVDFELIVIDNASEDKTRETLKDKYKNIKLLQNRENYGLSRAWNQGIAFAHGDYICCLNDDVVLRKGFLSNLRLALESDVSVGAAQPKVLKPDGRHIDTTGIALTSLRRFYDIGSGKRDGDGYNRQKYIFGSCDAAVMYRREALNAIRKKEEYFDEDFFCLVEDVDLSWRMQKAGWRTLYCPEAACIHYRGLSRKKEGFTQYLSMKNRYLMILKNESVAGFLRLPLIFLAYDIWRTLYMAIFSPRYCLKALNEVAKLSPRMMEKRWSR